MQIHVYHFGNSAGARPIPKRYGALILSFSCAEAAIQ